MIIKILTLSATVPEEHSSHINSSINKSMNQSPRISVHMSKEIHAFLAGLKRMTMSCDEGLPDWIRKDSE
jgi:hypothetical protein